MKPALTRIVGETAAMARLVEQTAAMAASFDCSSQQRDLLQG